MTSGSTKNPEEEAQHPAPMPKARRGGQHREKPHAKMAVHPGSPPGIELDGHAHVIPIDQRTEGDRRKALAQDKRK